MSLVSLSQKAIIVCTFLLLAHLANAWPHRHSGKKARVHFLAESTLVRGNWGWNEDAYLAELRLPKQAELVLVRLVDSYPNEAPPLSYAVLTAESGASFHVKRDQECDRPFGTMPLRAAPGDLMAILPMRLSYQPKMDRMPESGAILPCYRVARR